MNLLSLYQIPSYVSKLEQNPLNQESLNIVKLMVNEAPGWSLLTLLAFVQFQKLVANLRVN